MNDLFTQNWKDFAGGTMQMTYAIDKVADKEDLPNKIITLICPQRNGVLCSQ